MRAVRQRFVTERGSLHLFLRMHLLRKLFERTAKRLSKLRRRTGTQASTERRRPITSIRRDSNPADFLMALCAGLFAVNPHPRLRVEPHLLPAPAESCRKRRRAIGR